MDKAHRLDTLRTLKRFTCFMPALALLAGLVSSPLASAGWSDELERRLSEIDQAYPGELGVYVRDMDSGESVGLRDDEYWYLASTVKVPVAIAVLQAVDRGELALTEEITLKPEDYVDGAGETNWTSPGDRLSVRYLFEQMLVHSDNTATDVLIRVVGLDAVNDVVTESVSGDVGDITTLADVRRAAYGYFHPSARAMDGADFFAVKKASGKGEQARLDALARALDVELSSFQVDNLDAAFDAYYDSRLNAGRLSPFMELFEALANEELLEAESREYLLATLARIETGNNRIKAGLADNVRFYHKTGTQHRRACNLGLATADTANGRKRVVIAACGRGTGDLQASERAFREIGEAVSDSGVLGSPGS